MRHLMIAVLLLGLLTLGTAVFAADEYGSEYSQKAYQGVRAQVGWADPGDLDSAFIWGASYIWKNALLSANYFTSNIDEIDGDAKVLSLEASYIWRCKKDPGLYYGLGYGLARADVSWDSVSASQTEDDEGGSDTQTKGMWNIVVGKEFNSPKQFGKPGMFAELRWNLGSKFSAEDGSGDIDGARLLLGWKF